MNQLKQSNDPNSGKVRNVLSNTIDEFKGETIFSRNTLFRKIREEGISVDEFMFLSKARLNAATEFVPFLSAIQYKAERSHTWDDVSQALRKNLDEELGLTEEGYDKKKDHNTWREEYAYGLSRVQLDRLRNDPSCRTRLYDHIDVSNATEEIRGKYGKKLMKLARVKDLPFLVGAFTTLEGLLEQEFNVMHSYIREKITSLTTDEMFYIAHHAGHEHRHLEEIRNPLLQMCQKYPHIVPSVLEGIGAMYNLRCDHVLSVIEKEMELSKARCTDTSK